MKDQINRSRFFPAIVIFCFSILISLNSRSQTVSLVTNGISSYKIVVSKQNTKDYDAAKQLSSYINQISGAVIPVVNDDVVSQDKEIVIGNNKHAKALNLSNEPHNNNTCIIKTSGSTILLYGDNDDNSSADCVFYFVEKYLGCMVLASDVTIIPKNKTIQLSSANETYTPSFTYRDLYYKDTYDSTYMKFNRVDHFDAGGQNRKWGEIWSSSFNYVLPKQKYFPKHPEWFALNANGKRIPNQLDLTNDDMFKEYVKNFRRLIQRFPNSKVWAVAPNDASAPNYCHCDKCMAINNREGTPMGALLTFVNKVAAQFPGKTIATQAYRYYEEPPKNLKPASNVLIVEAGSFLLNHQEPYETSKEPDTKTYCRRLTQWLNITKNVRVWDYEINFFYLMFPFPNLQVQQQNLQYFARLGVKDIFMQGNIAIGGDIAQLRAYLLAKLAWNPNANTDDIINTFTNNYYGKAAPYIKEYLSLTTSSLLKSGIPLTVHDSVSKHSSGFLAPELLLQYNQIFDNAENAVKDNADQLNRVKEARLSLMYAMLETQRKSNRANIRSLTTNNSSAQNVLAEFVQVCKKNNVVKLSEGAETVDSYQQKVANIVK